MQEIAYAMKGILVADVTNVLLVTEDIHIVSPVRAVELVALILTRVREIVHARYDIEIVPYFLTFTSSKNVIEHSKCNSQLWNIFYMQKGVSELMR